MSQFFAFGEELQHNGLRDDVLFSEG